MTRRQGIIALTFAALAWSSSYVIIKATLGQIGPFGLSVLRLLIGGFVLLPFAWKQGFRPRLMGDRTFWLFGLTGVALFQGLQNMGLVYTSALSVSLILAAVPAAVTIFAILFLRERVGWIHYVGLGLTAIGAVVISITPGADTHAANAPLGNLLIIGAIFAWAAYTIQGKRLASGHSATVMTEASLVAGLVILVPFTVAEWLNQGLPMLTWRGALAILYLGAVPLALTTVLWNQALKTVKASVAGLYINLIPLLGVLIALSVGESMTLRQGLGGALTLAGVWLSTWAERSKNREQKA